MARIAGTLKDNDDHFDEILPILREQRFLPAGRIQASVGAARQTTAFNCYVSDTIEDSRLGIFQRLQEAAQTMGLGGGDGFDFSTIRPRGALIKSQGSGSSGPVSYMRVWDTMCETIASAGNRRGAMMGVMRVDHPDVEEFIDAKRTAGELKNFNISVAITDAFMQAMWDDTDFDLIFDGVVFKTVSARALWMKIMRSTWSHAEPGVLFIDTINKKNNLAYCEVIAATNPCGEQPLPPNGACLLGSFNLTKYVFITYYGKNRIPQYHFDSLQLTRDIPPIIRMMDNVVDRTIYPLEAQEIEAKNKRRMGIGVTGLANAAAALGYDYGSKDMLSFMTGVMTILRDEAYLTSIQLAKEKGAFPLFNDEYMNSPFIQTLPEDIQRGIIDNGIRNSHLLSIAPTGTISLFAGNISSGIEPPFSLRYDRRTLMSDSSVEWWPIYDYAYDVWGIKGKTSADLTAQEHIDVLCVASSLVDSACSKTCNVGDDVKFEDFQQLYVNAYKGGASGCTTFRPASIATRGEVMRDTSMTEDDGAVCTINPVTGERSCAD
tara:strand:- start:1311 stop:2951 length:1641 start_codon:yes stop_codon:yes gene_type:complete